MSEIKERPILFSGPMVRAILDGRKTVTRREIKPRMRSADTSFELHQQPDGSWRPMHTFDESCMDDLGTEHPITCPYGQPGDRLWVRETWQDVHPVQVIDRFSQPGRAGIPGPPGVTYQTIYRADGEYPAVYHTNQHPYRCLEPDQNHGLMVPAESGWTGWTPSIHMPRWASRILLEITDVRVERLQDISEEQAQAEGCFFTDYGQECFHGGTGWKDVGICPAQAGHRQRTGWAWDKTTSHEECLGTPRWAFANLWNSTGGDWYANPWVWVVELKRVTP